MDCVGVSYDCVGRGEEASDTLLAIFPLAPGSAVAPSSNWPSRPVALTGRLWRMYG